MRRGRPYNKRAVVEKGRVLGRVVGRGGVGRGETSCSSRNVPEGRSRVIGSQGNPVLVDRTPPPPLPPPAPSPNFIVILTASEYHTYKYDTYVYSRNGTSYV
jgi:hypothetical protein